MTHSSFSELFLKATGEKPFPYQIAFAEARDQPELVHAPTGAGKTATAILGWLWRLLCSGNPTPRRLVYCLPMRILVEQTRDEAKRWVERLGLDVPVQVLMGGEDTDEWDLEPDRQAILIGTQDMLLSRALNRGYGMSRFRWPMHFGLLNNDSLWVLDEIQLMGVGLATSAQLQAFRERFGAFGNVKTVWMSATLRPDWLATVDFRERVRELTPLTLTHNDYRSTALDKRWSAKKPIAETGLKVDDVEKIASLIREQHQPGSLTLVVVNTVDRSRVLFEAVRGLYQPGQTKGGRKKAIRPTDLAGPAPDIKLIHSRFRPMEREKWMGWLKADPPPEGRIVISTQVVEAGVDLSARTLFTELAPWPNLVQRFGRCNRRGEFTDDQPARIYWIDVEDDKQAAPYAKTELDEARVHLKTLADGGLKSLDEFFQSRSDEDKATLFPFNPPHIVRRKDLIDLFDTTPDLAGNDIDVSRFIREGDELDVQVFWRSDSPPPGELEQREARRIAPVRTELCPVPIGSFRGFIEKGKRTAYRWDSLDGQWTRAIPDSVSPGQVFWVPCDQGGYSRETGWDAKSPWGDELEIPAPGEQTRTETYEPKYDSDLLSVHGWRSIAEHTDEVISELGRIADGIDLKGSLASLNALQAAIRWHDWGKAHKVFQDAIRDDSEGEFQRPADRAGRRDIAKAPSEGFWVRYARRHFRHELASAIGVLTLLRQGSVPADWVHLSAEQRDLALYLIAAHHGKVRLSIRSLPDENKPEDADRLFARGIHDGDLLPGVNLGGGAAAPDVPLDLSPMQLGRGDDGSPSWAERMLRLRDHTQMGPLRLAFLEVIVRAADMRASKKADQKARR